MSSKMREMELLVRKGLLTLLCVAALAGVSVSPLRGQAADAPTSNLPAAVIDQQWKQASAKYDRQRQEILAHVESTNAHGPFTPDWDSLAKMVVPDWYRDAKFGIFIHWGVYSVPAFGSEWYPRDMYRAGTEDNKHQIATYGPLTQFGYKDFIPRFTAAKYDPRAWARLFRESGARYVVPVFEHHDGFQMYDSDLSDWTAKKMGPHRDLVGELATAVRAEGLHLGASSHRVEHDWFLDGGRTILSDVNDPAYAAFYGPAHHRIAVADGNALSKDFTAASPEYLDDWLARNAEIVDKYHPEIMYFDWWIGQPLVRPYLARFASYYYNASSARGPVGVINYKYDAMEEGSGVLDLERGQLDHIRELPWQTDTSISDKSWGYIEHDTFKSPEFVVDQLVDIVSKNGNLLMNIGPRSDGTIPDEVQRVLLAVGAWLKVNGEAIYGTRPWKLYGEGPTKVAAGSFNDVRTSAYTAQDFRFTTKGNTLYAIELAWPQNRQATIRSLGTATAGNTGRVRSVSLLGTAAAVSFEQRADGLYLHLPETAPSNFAVSFKIEMQ
jgi:alpha-L-fucosidase